MFLSRVQIDFYWVRSIRIGSFRDWVYSGRFLSVSVLLGKRNLDPNGTCKFLVRFWIGYFFQSRLKCSGLVVVAATVLLGYQVKCKGKVFNEFYYYKRHLNLQTEL